MVTGESGLFIAPDGGKVITNPIGGRMVIKASRGGYSLHENILPPNSPGPRPHIHYRHEEVFYVLDGELTLRMGEETISASVGSFVVIPPGTVHQPSNAGSQPARVLIFFSPASMAEFFEEAAQRRIPLQGVSTDPDVLAALANFCKKFDFAFADFPAKD